MLEVSLAEKYGFTGACQLSSVELIENKGGNTDVLANSFEKTTIKNLMENNYDANKFYNEVYKYIVAEKIVKRFQYKLAPNSKILKAGLNNLRFHMEYIDYLADRNNYLAGNTLTLADLAVAAHLSIIDYLGDIPWEEYKNAKLWYPLRG